MGGLILIVRRDTINRVKSVNDAVSIHVISRSFHNWLTDHLCFESSIINGFLPVSLKADKYIIAALVKSPFIDGYDFETLWLGTLDNGKVKQFKGLAQLLEHS